MAKRSKDWFPQTRPKQLVMFTNVNQKIGGYKDKLPFPTAKVDRVQLICETFIALYNFVEQTRATAQQLTDYQDLILTADGGTQGEAAPAVPVFQVLTLPAGAFVGLFAEFRELRDDILAADNYTRGIGEDLMIVAAEGEETDAAEIVAAIKPTALADDYKVRVEGRMQGMKAMRVEYLKKGDTVPQSFYLTNLPAEIKIAPTEAGQPESGSIRAILIENNEDVGQWSPSYRVTVSD